MPRPNAGTGSELGVEHGSEEEVGWRWESFIILGNALRPVALPSGMRCGLARSVMHLARLVMHVLKSVLRLYWTLWLLTRHHSPTDPCSPLCLLALHCSHMLTAIVSIQLLVLP